jgi:hypothetical protein
MVFALLVVVIIVIIVIFVVGPDAVANRDLHPRGDHAGSDLEVDGVVGDANDRALQA